MILALILIAAMIVGTVLMIGGIALKVAGTNDALNAILADCLDTEVSL